MSAPFIAQFFYDQLMSIVPYCDFIFGSELEAEAWGTRTGHPSPKDIPAVAKSLAAVPKHNTSRPRVVLITQGTLPTVVVSSDDPENVRTFPVDRLKDEEIVDTNGAGDAFAGGFLAGIISGKTLDEAVIVGHKLSQISVKQVGRAHLACFAWMDILRHCTRLGPNINGPRWNFCRSGNLCATLP